MMKIVDWKKLFAPHILDRGLRYYEEGLVKIEAMDGGSIEAAVEGTDTYCVEILVREGHVMQMDCDCPYARDGNNCKHMAAVLLAAEDEESTIDLHRADNSSWENDRSAPTDRELEQAVAAFSEEQVRKLLLDAAKRHGDVRNRIVLSGKAAIDPSLPIRWETELSMISRRASDRDGSIDYSHAFAYTTELSEYLDENIEPLLENDLVMDAFRLVGLVFLEAMSQEMDDSDGGLSLLASDCVAYWERLIPSPKADQHKMLDWFQAQIKRFFGEFAEDVLWSVTLECFTDADLLTQILAMADSQIRSANEFSLQGAIERRIALMERMGASDSEIRAYRKDHWAMPFIRNQELDRLEQKNGGTRRLRCYRNVSKWMRTIHTFSRSIVKGVFGY